MDINKNDKSRKELAYIGPTECNKSRKDREKRLNKVWKIIISSEKLIKMYLIIGQDIDLFREALSCYQNGAFMSTILMCGVFQESLLYDLVYATKGNVSCTSEGLIWKFEPSTEWYNLKFGVIIQEAKKTKILDNKLEKKITKARSLRNIIAHYAQKRRSFQIQGYNSEELDEKIINMGWASDKDAYHVLEKSAKIARILVDKAYEILCSKSDDRPNP